MNRTVTGLSMRSARDVTISTPIADRSHHIFFPYFGGADDRVALRFVLQLAQNPTVTATIIYLSAPAVIDPTGSELSLSPPSRAHNRKSRDQQVGQHYPRRKHCPRQRARWYVFSSPTRLSPLGSLIPRRLRHTRHHPPSERALSRPA
jgi:hypothetical protein